MSSCFFIYFGGVCNNNFRLGDTLKTQGETTEDHADRRTYARHTVCVIIDLFLCEIGKRNAFQNSLTWTIMGDVVPGILTATERYMACLPFRDSWLKKLPLRKGLVTPSFFEGRRGVSFFFFNGIPPENKWVFPNHNCHCKNYTLFQEA